MGDTEAAYTAFAGDIEAAMKRAEAAGLDAAGVYLCLASAIGYAAANESPSAELTNRTLAYAQQVMVEVAAETFSRPRKSQVN